MCEKISFLQFGEFRDETERPFSLDDLEMDSEQPIESPGSSMDMPDSPISGIEMRGGQRPVSVKPSAYLEKQKSESAKVYLLIL